MTLPCSELLKLKKLTCRAVAKKYNMSPETARKWLMSCGLNKSYKSLQRRDKAVRERYREGLKAEDIAVEFDISISTVYRVCEGIKRSNPALKNIGCEDCVKKPYAKGLCKKCYDRKWRQENPKKRAKYIKP